MKVTFDIPNRSLCAVLSVVYSEGCSLSLGSMTIDTDDLCDGAELVYDPKGGKD